MKRNIPIKEIPGVKNEEGEVPVETYQKTPEGSGLRNYLENFAKAMVVVTSQLLLWGVAIGFALGIALRVARFVGGF